MLKIILKRRFYFFLNIIIVNVLCKQYMLGIDYIFNIFFHKNLCL